MTANKLFGTRADLVIMDDVQPKYDEWEDQATLLSCKQCGKDNLSLFEYVELYGNCHDCFKRDCIRSQTDHDIRRELVTTGDGKYVDQHTLATVLNEVRDEDSATETD